MSDSERSAEPIRRHDEPSSRPQPLLPTRAQRGASRLTPAVRPPRTSASLEHSPPCAPSAADGWRAASAAVRLFGGTTSHHRILDSYYRRERTAERVARWPSAARFELQPATNHPYLAPVGCLPQPPASFEPPRLVPRRLPPGGCPPRTTPRHEPSPPRAPSAADGRRTASAAVRLFGGTTSHHRILNLYYRRERTAERVGRCPSAACPEPQMASNHSSTTSVQSGWCQTASVARSLFGSTTSHHRFLDLRR